MVADNNTHHNERQRWSKSIFPPTCQSADPIRTWCLKHLPIALRHKKSSAHLLLVLGLYYDGVAKKANRRWKSQTKKPINHGWYTVRY